VWPPSIFYTYSSIIIGGKKDLKRNLIKKICMLGDGAVGKTSLIRRYVFDDFEDKYLATIGAKVTKKVLEMKGEESQDIHLTMMINDIVGQVEFEKIHRQYYRGSEGALLVCDLTRKETLEHMDWWLVHFYEVVGEVPVVLLGNKKDLGSERQVSDEEMASYANRLNCDYFLTSAKTGESVERAFESLGRRVCGK
jgi:small GTP-binding protein